MSAEFQDPHLAPTRYYDRHFSMSAVKILPGEFYVTHDPQTLIVTVLGSCVSVCLRDPVLGVAGMNHFLLPETNDTDSIISASARYGSYAMELLINHLLKLGAKRDRLEAKVFGGGNVLRGVTVTNVGQRNVDFTLDFLGNEQIPIVASDLLQQYPRKVYFFPKDGKVLVKKIKSLHNATIIERESEYRLNIRKAPQGGEVDLF
ncbi:Protein-glutamine glutaminase [Saliniradius amylolyticus]|uniref:Probable chemoreceptor glutamine deamidase CheD n=1 Tax=Saliniradius amylolyticus TaxID=2183582 RepID=A0A2S2E3L2_9ALTE|nr:chemoreceptor glutamine deamidase CheD [Saliniradius amylolyticus]AWL12102.1 Protein-glutamine glutaminase [Saliniradius amylolyticus]